VAKAVVLEDAVIRGSLLGDPETDLVLEPIEVLEYVEHADDVLDTIGLALALLALVDVFEDAELKVPDPLKRIDLVIKPLIEPVRVPKGLALTLGLEDLVLDPRPLAELVGDAVPVLELLIEDVPVLLNAIV
jgi:hypothetical protein